MATPRRIELLIERRLAIRDTGLTLDQLEYLSTAGRPIFTPYQRWLWTRVIYPIGLELGAYTIIDDKDEDDDGLAEA